MERSYSNIRKRRKYYTLPIQLKYTVVLSLAASSLFLIMVFVTAWFLERNYNIFLGDELGISSQVVHMVRNEQRILEVVLFILFLVSVTLMFATAFFVTRKLTGPIIALERHLALLVSGDWTKTFKLRKNDEFQDLEQLVNDLRTYHLETVGRSHSSSPQRRSRS